MWNLSDIVSVEKETLYFIIGLFNCETCMKINIFRNTISRMKYIQLDVWYSLSFKLLKRQTDNLDFISLNFSFSSFINKDRIRENIVDIYPWEDIYKIRMALILFWEISTGSISKLVHSNKIFKIFT